MNAYRILKEHFNEKLKFVKTNTYTTVTNRNNFLKELERYHNKTQWNQRNCSAFQKEIKHAQYGEDDPKLHQPMGNLLGAQI